VTKPKSWGCGSDGEEAEEEGGELPEGELTLFPHRLRRTDVYRDVDYGRGPDLARASGQPVQDPVGVRVGWVESTLVDGVYRTAMKAFVDGNSLVETYATEAEALEAHDRLVVELKALY
jgi:hypothetical protein